MSHGNPQRTAGANPAVPANPYDDPSQIILGTRSGVTLLSDMDALDVYMAPPLPGIAIFVHGVNSDGEWYAETESGLCAGLNERLKRCDEHMAYPTAKGGQLTPATYMPQLTADGYINPDMTHKTFIEDDDHFTPVIHFRWGYKASSEELQKYGDGIYLNEKNFWGGGPFANGCTSLPDLWSEGLSENLFLFMHIQHLNPVNSRNVFACPPKPYFVLAALRLAKLVESIRKKQADVPITIVCHSQGNMIGMAAAFFGDAMPPVRDAAGVEGRCVADTYVLCNPPYSLTASNDTESWSQSDMQDKHGGRGRQNRAARIATLRAFFDIIRQPASRRQNIEEINQAMQNTKHPFDAATDCKAYGYGAGATCSRVTLYCNPHDQVISSLSVQGIGWRGMSQKEIDDAGAAGIFSQRVFAQDHEVGKQGAYHYWRNHYNRPAAGTQGYWTPASPEVEYRVGRGLDASRSALAKVLTVLVTPVAILGLKLSGLRVNALPDKQWTIPIDAPNLPRNFQPLARRFGATDSKFVQAYDAPGQSRDRTRQCDADDPYAGDRPLPQKKGEDRREATDAAQGDADSEAAMRYEDHARLRMQARREGMAKKTDQHVEGEDDATKASAEYKAWREQKIKTYLADNVDEQATNHSTILTNGMHAQMALAYDVAIGLNYIRDKDMHQFRIAADWRFLKGLDDEDSSKVFLDYFLSGKFKGVSAFEWANRPGEGRMPDKIVDQREHPPLQPRTYGPGDHP